ncbi:GNAT family N-acetyltransferase [Paenibacillus mucilaginosus]|uniref:GCN5-related N-acetyltransferase n=1 Tax=Paenibacillus mucilaginosus (strain KNP414) TaxID=1036673 RepID=F8FBA9_PAEMK|nr:GNAT family N-acetyltransferase [Paenibacillus mucilaginosus]AEI42076.1 GCN5-related N-acetyltransferase [Paenibacillus mucilaginosus KNP414]MCG7214063.1 GNAT family N-acetyltransferase [Paenibacillus mucilaginosus]WDM28587.1 GNAT family N-acetyltransferase [Paenibacillus mucilaginosus]
MSGNINIRRMGREDWNESLDLSSFAFQYPLTPEEREERLAQMVPEEQWGAYVEDKLAARMTVLNLETWIQGKVYAMGGIAGVATWPEYRRGGLVSKLLCNALSVMREQGQTVSFLHPFQFAFYRRYGWETYAEYKQYEIAVGQLPRFEPQGGRVVRGEPDIALLDSLYETYAPCYNGMLKRTESWWKNRILERKKGTTAVYYGADGEAAGYVHYQVKDRVCTVHELVHLKREARLALWRFLADHDSMIDKLVIRVPNDDRLPFLLDDPRIKQETIPYFMARIVDVKSFIEKYPFVSGAEAAFLLEIQDEHADWNNGVFTVTVDESGTARVAAEPLQVSDLPSVSCSIQTLTALLTGYQRPSFLQDIGRLQGTLQGLGMLERLVPARTTYLADFF